MPEGTALYDEFHYPSYAHQATHPDNLATIARLLGVAAADPRHCRVLELGCATGGNLIPMAAALPDSAFLGLDLSGPQVEAGQQRAAQLGLGNLSLRAADLLDVDLGTETWDYVLCHGVYSWVDEPRREAILALCRRHLAPQGVACISYNIYPGWHEAEGLLHLLRYHDDPTLAPVARAQRARDLLDQVLALLDADDTRRPFLESQRKRLSHLADAYILYEYLEGDNQPCYLHAFLARAERHGLKYLGNGGVASMLVDNQPAPVAAVLRAAQTVVQAQQALDLLTNSRFRTTLLVHDQTPVDWDLRPEWLRPMYVRADVEPEPAEDDREVDSDIEVTSPSWGAATLSGDVRIALSVLRAEAPRALAWGELIERLVERLRRAQRRDWQESPERAHQLEHDLGAHLTRLWFGEVVDIHTCPAQVANRLSARPTASPVARDEAESTTFVTSQWHQPRWRNPFTRALVRLLDGSRDRAELLAALEEEVGSGRLALPDPDEDTGGTGPWPPGTDTSVPETVTQALDMTLEQLRREGLLVD